MRGECARRDFVEDGQPDENDNVNDENATSRSRSRVIPGLRDDLLDPRCVLRRGRGRRRGMCIRAAVGRELSVVRVFALSGCSCAVVDEGGLSRSISEFEKQSQSGVRSILLGVLSKAPHDLQRATSTCPLLARGVRPAPLLILIVLNRRLSSCGCRLPFVPLCLRRLVYTARRSFL